MTQVQDSHFYRPEEGHGLAHCPLKAIVAPRPIGWISTVNAEGRANLAPYSFFNLICEQPPILAFSSKGRKDTLRNVEQTGEFVANLATFPLAERMNVTAAELASEVDELEHAMLERQPGRMVAVPRVAAAPAALECKALGVDEIRDLRGVGTNWHRITGQIVGIHIDPDYIRDGLLDTAAAEPIARCGYRGQYAHVDSLFEMVRPNEASALFKPAAGKAET